MESPEKLLAEHRFLEGLCEEHRRFLASCAQLVCFAGGQSMLLEGSDADTLYLLLEGRVWLEARIPGRGTVLLETLGSGDILGLSWLFEPYRWYLDGRAADAVRALAFDAKCLRAKMDEDHDLGYALAMRLLRQIYTRLERTRMQRLDLYLAEAAGP